MNIQVETDHKLLTSEGGGSNYVTTVTNPNFYEEPKIATEHVEKVQSHSKLALLTEMESLLENSQVIAANSESPDRPVTANQGLQKKRTWLLRKPGAQNRGGPPQINMLAAKKPLFL